MEGKVAIATFCLFVMKIRPYLAMVSLQFGYAGMSIITMVSLKRGMSHWVLVVYRHAVATLVMAPFALVLERKIRPKMTLSVFFKVMLLALLEPVIDQNLYFLGMKYTSATFASATVNVLPGLTFILAIIFRMEKVNFKKLPSIAKVIGTVVTLTGALVMTLYKGPIIDFLGSGVGSNHQNTAAAGSTSTDQHWVQGTIMLLSCTAGWSGFFILQSMTLKEYPAELSLTVLICLMGTVEGGAVGLVMERDMSAWAIGFDNRLLAATYSGVVCSGIAYYVQGVVNRLRGPVFVTAFSPLGMIITAVLGAILLAEKVHLGSLIGAAIIVLGLYSVVWGKSKDQCSAENTLISENDKANGIYELPVVADGNRLNIGDGITRDYGTAPAKINV